MDLYNLVVSAKLSKGEGGDVDVDALTVTENGTYTAEEGHAYSPVTVNVPSVTPTGNINITSTAQTDVSAYATAQVVDADLVAGNIKKDVNILGVVGTYEGGGGGGSSYELLHEEDIEVSTTSSSETLFKNIVLPSLNTSDLLFIEITDKAGPRTSHFYKSISLIANTNVANGQAMEFGAPLVGTLAKNDDGLWYANVGRYGIFPRKISANGEQISIFTRYNGSVSYTIDGTYHIGIYKLALPDGSSSPFPT